MGRWTLALLAALLAGHSGDERPLPNRAAADNPGASRDRVSAPQRTEVSADRLREGSKVTGRVGQFKFTGDRLTFYPNGTSEQLIALENLNLERIARMISDTPGTHEWSVDGTLTEYRGANYLLVTRALLKTRQPSR